jgi:plastocyanin
VRRLAVLLAVAVPAASGVALASALASARADAAPLRGSVGPGFAISLEDGSGAAVTRLEPGSTTLTVEDESDVHDFHLSGPGVDVTTTIDEIGQKTFTLTLVDGTYSFICDAHPLTMKGAFTVGSGPAAPPTTTSTPPLVQPQLLRLAVTNRALTLQDAGASAVRRLRPGVYVVRVSDRSRTQNVHLLGAGVNRKTGIAFTGTVTWRLTLRKGTLVFRSDARPATLTVGKAAVS